MNIKSSSAIALLTATGFALAGCNSTDSTPPDPFTSTNESEVPTPQPDPSSSPGKPEPKETDPKEIYQAKLDGLGATGDYLYAYLELNGTEPEELLIKDDSGEIGTVTVYSVKDNELIEAHKTFQDGAATSGGARFGLTYLPQSQALQESQGNSLRGGSSSMWIMQGNQFVDSGPSDDSASEPIDWQPLSAQASSAQSSNAQSSNGRSKADYPNYSGDANSSDPNYVPKTSQPFARAVYDAFIENWIATGKTEPTLEVYSETTGQSYTMTCREDKSITCTGGNGARVMIYPPTPDPSTLPHGVQWG